MASSDRLHLYTNDKIPRRDDAASDYTEAAGAGYASRAFESGLWTVAAGDPSRAEYPEQVFLFTGDLGLLFGYYVTASGALAWAERFPDGPYRVARLGDQIALVPRFELGPCR